MLELRPNCECCGKDLPPAADNVMICTFRLKAWRDHLPMLLIWMSREEAFAHIVSVVERGAIDEDAADLAAVRS